MQPRNLSIKDFTYDLPAQKIANYPLAERDESRLLIYRKGNITEDIYHHLANHIPPDSLLVFNNTKVIEARLLFQKPTGGVIELFCLEPDEQYPDITTAMRNEGQVLWKCLVGGASKWKKGQRLQKQITNGSKSIVLHAAYKEKGADHFIIQFSWSPADLTFAEILHGAGAIPLPPYIKRPAEASDAQRYQTVYANTDGSVAAPTAGLHFTPYVFDRLKERNIQTAFVTLHVGAGTFKPVKTQTIGDHDMHAESISVSSTTIEQLLNKIGDDIIAVGTTSLRTVESLYWLGVKTMVSPSIENPELTQWEVYDGLPNNIDSRTALQSLLAWMRTNDKEFLVTKTQIIIVPGYQPRLATAIITNFHQPSSTLLLLVAALIGDQWKKVYDYALKNNFRFLSYGDGSLLWIDR